MKIEIDTDSKYNNPNQKKPSAHSGLYLLLALTFVIFAILYVYGYILYTA
jgi:hypothetical protein